MICTGIIVCTEKMVCTGKWYAPENGMYRKMVCTEIMVFIEKINRLRNRIAPGQRRLSFNPMKKLSDSFSFESCSQSDESCSQSGKDICQLLII